MAEQYSLATNVAYYDRVAPLYGAFFADLAGSMEAEGSWLDSVLRPRGVSRVLDASCGTGRQSIPLARRGYDVVGADPSVGMLRAARLAAADHGVSITLIATSFAELPGHFGPEFDAVITLGNALCHAGSGWEVARSLTALAHCCRPGGFCLVGIKNFEKIREERPRLYPRGAIETSDGLLQLVEMWEYSDPCLTVTVSMVSLSDRTLSTELAVAREYMLLRDELEAMALAAGFSKVQVLKHSCELVFQLEKP